MAGCGGWEGTDGYLLFVKTNKEDFVVCEEFISNSCKSKQCAWGRGDIYIGGKTHIPVRNVSGPVRPHRRMKLSGAR